MKASKIVAQEAARLRKAKGLSQDHLSQLLNGWGYSLDRSSLAKLEQGNRGISIDDTLALAAVLDVAPVHLLAPQEDTELDVTPDVTVVGAELRSWIRGLHPLDTPLAQEQAYWSNMSRAEWFATRNGVIARLQTLVGQLSRACTAGQHNTEPEQIFNDLMNDLNAGIQKAQAALDLLLPADFE